MASHKGTGMTALLLGIVGAGLFYGDSFITPAISVMSAVEGLTVANPDAEKIVLPASVVILTLLFIVQRRGTEVIGKA
ncbi:KUP/HAK/KT family potassium transporter, partial [Pseudomonas aeruginosa]